MLSIAAQLVRVNVTPAFRYSFDAMRPGVLQHLDRRYQYSYDVVPPPLLDSLLFQGIHQLPKGTRFDFQLSSAATVYFIFHWGVDGGYNKIFHSEDMLALGWRRSPTYPQYDIHGEDDHGLFMLMYELEAEANVVYTIPPTLNDKWDGACASLAFQPQPPAREWLQCQFVQAQNGVCDREVVPPPSFAPPSEPTRAEVDFGRELERDAWLTLELAARMRAEGMEGMANNADLMQTVVESQHRGILAKFRTQHTP